MSSERCSCGLPNPGPEHRAPRAGDRRSRRGSRRYLDPRTTATCINCGQPITGDVAEFVDFPGRCFCMPCVNDLGTVLAHLLARTAPDSVWMTDPETGTFVTGLLPDEEES